MKLTEVDRRLEHKLRELYEAHMERTSKIDWSYHTLIPWERARNFQADPYHPSQACSDTAGEPILRGNSSSGYLANRASWSNISAANPAHRTI